MFHVYILLSEKTGKFYIGSTGNLEDRLSRHTTGRSKATFSGRHGNYFGQKTLKQEVLPTKGKWRLKHGKVMTVLCSWLSTSRYRTGESWVQILLPRH